MRNVEKMRPRMSAMSPKASVIDAERRINHTLCGLFHRACFLIEDAIENFVELGFVGQQDMEPF